MNNEERPPPYLPSAPPTGPTTYPGWPYQSFPQSFTGGGDQSYYHGPPGPPGPPGPYLTQPGYQGYYSGPPHLRDPCRENPKQTVFVVDQNPAGSHGAGFKDCLAACSAVLCCCSLWNMLT